MEREKERQATVPSSGRIGFLAKNISRDGMVLVSLAASGSPWITQAVWVATEIKDVESTSQ